MINFSNLEQLIAFYHTGTLSKAAEKLNISQSTITRNMQKLEAELAVPIFHRTKNSISLNETGIRAAKYAEMIVKKKNEMFDRIREFAKENESISIGSCSLVMTDKHLPIRVKFPNAKVTSEIKTATELIDGLYGDKYQIIFLPFSITSSELVCKKIDEENLMFCLPEEHKYAGRESLSFADMNGESILLVYNIGFWESIVKEKMPDSRLLIQREDYSFFELISNSRVPCFTSDKFLDYYNLEGRVSIPISDDEASVSYYMVLKKENMSRFSFLFDK